MKEPDIKKTKVYLIAAAVLFFAAGIITLLANNQSGAIGWMFIILGSAQLTLVAALSPKK